MRGPQHRRGNERIASACPSLPYLAVLLEAGFTLLLYICICWLIHKLQGLLVSLILITQQDDYWLSMDSGDWNSSSHMGGSKLFIH